MEIEAQNGNVIFKHPKGSFTVTLHRTVRLPEDGKTHALPPSVGVFPVKRVDDYRDKVPGEWVKHGGIFLPMYEREALWLGFTRNYRFPCAVKVAAGKINAVSGKPWSPELAPADESDSKNPRQDYMVAPPQPWLDGFNTGEGKIRQFVATAMGKGYTVEGQVSGEEKFGGLQLLVVPATDKFLKKQRSGPRGQSASDPIEGGVFHLQGMGEVHDGDAMIGAAINSVYSSAAPTAGVMRSAGMQPQRKSLVHKGAQMGLGAGGEMVQKIYPDPHGIDTWDASGAGRLFIHMVDATLWKKITGEEAPASPLGAGDYNGPYYQVSDGGAGDVPASETLTNVKTVGQKDKEHGFEGQQDDSPAEGYPVLLASTDTVRDGEW